MGSFIFFAPEMFTKAKDQKIRGEQTDIWAMGVTMFYLLAGKYPAGDAKNLVQLKEYVTKRDTDFSCIKDPEARVVISKMLEKDPLKRADLEFILNSNWITNNGTEKIELAEVELEHDLAQKQGFGNLQRLLKTKALG